MTVQSFSLSSPAPWMVAVSNSMLSHAFFMLFQSPNTYITSIKFCLLKYLVWFLFSWLDLEWQNDVPEVSEMPAMLWRRGKGWGERNREVRMEGGMVKPRTWLGKKIVGLEVLFGVYDFGAKSAGFSSTRTATNIKWRKEKQSVV